MSALPAEETVEEILQVVTLITLTLPTATLSAVEAATRLGIGFGINIHYRRFHSLGYLAECGAELLRSLHRQQAGIR